MVGIVSPSLWMRETHHMNEINQIYHVARCGSTLLTYLLSQVTKAYAESLWARSVLIGVDPFKTAHKYYGSVVKFQSMVTCFPTRFDGKKVFLYRPLAQHLSKLKSVEPEWMGYRIDRMNYILENLKHPEVEAWQPKDPLDMAACIWACSVLRMIESTDVYWLQTNDLLNERQKYLGEVCDHFKLPPIKDFQSSYIDVKKININGQDTPVHETLGGQGNINQQAKVSWVVPSHGTIDTNLALLDEDIKRRVKYVENEFPTLTRYLY